MATGDRFPLAADDSGMSNTGGLKPTAVPLNDIPGTNTAPRKKTVLVAKKRTVGDCPEGVDQFVSPAKTVPLSILTAKTHGPRRTSDGRLIEHTVLGDPEDFEYFDSLHGDRRKFEEEEQVRKEVESTQPAKSEEHEVEAVVVSHEDEDRRRYLNTLHIFQRYRELRQEKALKNWNRHSVAWARVENTLAKSLKRDPRHLLMTRMAEYRMMVEERELLDQAIQLLEGGNVDFWKTNLKIGSDLVGLSMPLPRGGPREIERVQLLTSRRWPAHKNEYKKLRNTKLKSIMAILDPFYGRIGAGSRLEVVGCNKKRRQGDHESEKTFPLLRDIELVQQEYVDRVGQQVDKMRVVAETGALEESAESISLGVSERTSAASENKGSAQHSNSEKIANEGARLVIANRRLTFEVLTSEVATSALSVYNRGTKTLHFEWQKVTDHQSSWMRGRNRTTESCGLKSSADDGVQRFFFYHKRGTILPETAFDFPIMFVSRRPGIFKERWQLVTSPSLNDIDSMHMIITLQGLAEEEDTTEKRREEIERDLYRRQAVSTSREIIESILRNIPRGPERYPPRRTKSSRYRPTRNKDEEAFMLQNSSLGLYYSPAVFSRFQALHKEVLDTLSIPLTPATSWNASVGGLQELIIQIPEFQMRSGALRRLNAAVSDATFRGESSLEEVLMVIGYDLLVELSDRVAERSELIRRKLLIPVIRPCTVKFIEPKEEEAKPEGEGDGGPGGTAAGKGAGEKGGSKVGGSSAATGAGAGEAKGKVPAGKEPAGGKKAAAAKGGKGGAISRKDVEEEAAPAPPPVSKPPPDDRRTWSKERRVAESAYKSEFKSQVRRLLVETICRMEVLFDEASVGSKSSKTCT